MSTQVPLSPSESMIVAGIMDMDATTAATLKARYTHPRFRRESPMFARWLCECLEAVHGDHEGDHFELPTIYFSQFNDRQLGSAMVVALSQVNVESDTEAAKEFGEVLLHAMSFAAAARLLNEVTFPKPSSN